MTTFLVYNLARNNEFDSSKAKEDVKVAEYKVDYQKK